MVTCSAICLAKGDNVAVVTSDVRSGVDVHVDDRRVAVQGPIPFGHKIALVRIDKDDKIIKFGVAVGRAKTVIAAGEHVHVHNVESDYINNAVDHYEAAGLGQEDHPS